jgi:hypothetical protein
MIKKLTKYEKAVETNPNFGYNNVAFVTLNSEKIKDDYIKAAKKQYYGCCYSLYRSFQRWFCSSKLPFMVSRAPEPDDIKWRNIGFSEKARKSTIMLSGLIMNLVLFLSLVIQFYIKVVEKKIVKKYEDSDLWYH